MTTLSFVKLLPSLFSWSTAKVVHHHHTSGWKLSGKKSQAIALVAMAVAVGIGTVFSFALPEPEKLSAVSEDGRLTISGRGAPSGETRATLRGDLTGPFTSAVGSIYEIAFTGAAVGEPLELSLSYDGIQVGGVAPSNLVLLAYDRAFGAWEIHPAVPDPDTRRLFTTISTSDAGLWAVGRIPEQNLPKDTQVLLSELLASAPSNAVGYRAYTSVSTMDSDFVLVGRELARGGCGAAWNEGDTRTRTSRERRVGAALWRVTVLWELKEGGCSSE
jgi:hypothetical protein